LTTIEIIYHKNTSSYQEILHHLSEVETSFIPILSETVSLYEYAEKLFNKSIRYECWNKKRLIGLIAIYRNDNENIGYITNVSVVEEFSGNKIATKLMIDVLNYSKEHGLSRLDLHVNEANNRAISFYKLFGFKLRSLNSSKLLMSLEIKSN